MKMNPGLWFYITCLGYLVVGLINLFVYPFTSTEYIQAVWLVIMSAPLWIPPLGRWVGIKTFWWR